METADETKMNWLWYCNAAVAVDAVGDMARADGRMSAYAVADIDEASRIWADISGSVRCVVALNRSEESAYLADGEEIFLCERKLWRGVRWFTLESLKGGKLTNAAETKLYESPASDDFLQLGEVRKFIEHGLKSAPDYHRTILVLSGHGGSPASVLFSPGYKGVGLNSKNHLSVDELSEALAVNTDKRRIGIVAFDACQDASIELAVCLEGQADCLIASQSNTPGSGWNYSEWPRVFKELNAALDDPSWHTRAARKILESYARMKYRRATLSAVNLTALGPIKRALHSLSSITGAERSNLIDDLGAAQKVIDSHINRERYRVGGDSELVDIGALFGLLRAIALERGHNQIAMLAYDIISGIPDTQLLPPYYSSDIAHRHWCGLSIYFPVKGSIGPGREMYDIKRQNALRRFKAETRWHEIVAALEQ